MVGNGIMNNGGIGDDPRVKGGRAKVKTIFTMITFHGVAVTSMHGFFKRYLSKFGTKILIIIKYMNLMRSSTTRTKVGCKSGTTLGIRVSMGVLTNVKLRSHGRGILRTRKKNLNKKNEQNLDQPKEGRKKPQI